VRQDLKKQLIIPIILTTIFIVSSFVPIIQILIWTFDGVLVKLINDIVGADNTGNILTANIIANLLPTMILLFLFFKANSQRTKIITATLSMILMTAFIFFLTDGIFKDNDPYFLNLLINALISGTILTLIALLKFKQNKQGQALS
jgi:hypothetical protein